MERPNCRSCFEAQEDCSSCTLYQTFQSSTHLAVQPALPTKGRGLTLHFEAFLPCFSAFKVLGYNSSLQRWISFAVLEGYHLVSYSGDFLPDCRSFAAVVERADPDSQLDRSNERSEWWTS